MLARPLLIPTAEASPMKRALFLNAPLFFLVACQSQSLSPSPGQSGKTSQLPAVTVNDSCSAYTKASDCAGDAYDMPCTWVTVDTCPAGATCPAGVCVAANSCTSLTSADACQANANCAWSAIAATMAMPALCPVGQTCGGGGFCFERGSSGTTCLRLQPLACPASGACPPVQCDCPPPPATGEGGAGGGGTQCECPPPPTTGEGGAGGGGTCTCECPACPPGQACPACDCGCGQGGGGCPNGGGATIGSSGASGSGGSGTCT